MCLLRRMRRGREERRRRRRRRRRRAAAARTKQAWNELGGAAVDISDEQRCVARGRAPGVILEAQVLVLSRTEGVFLNRARGFCAIVLCALALTVRAQATDGHAVRLLVQRMRVRAPETQEKSCTPRSLSLLNRVSDVNGRSLESKKWWMWWCERWWVQQFAIAKKEPPMKGGVELIIERPTDAPRRRPGRRQVAASRRFPFLLSFQTKRPLSATPCRPPRPQPPAHTRRAPPSTHPAPPARAARSRAPRKSASRKAAPPAG